MDDPPIACGLTLTEIQARRDGLLPGLLTEALFWPPMQLRGTEFMLTDKLHTVWTAVTVLLMFLAIGFGATAFGKRFRLCSIATIVVFLVFGALTGMDGTRIAANLPTVCVGVWERINIDTFLIWIVVLAVALLRTPDTLTGGRDSR